MIILPKSSHAFLMNVLTIRWIYSRTSALTLKRQNSQLREIPSLIGPIDLAKLLSQKFITSFLSYVCSCRGFINYIY